MKKAIFIVVVLVALIAVAYFYFFQLKPTGNLRAINVVPENAIFVFEIGDPFSQWNTITQGEIWQYLKTHKHLSKIGESIDSLNASLKQNEFLWNMITSRPVSISAHRVDKQRFDFLYVVDLKEVSKFSFFKDHLSKMVGKGTRVSKRTYHDTEIVELAFKDSRDLLYLYIKDNLITLSSTHVLIEQSIDQKDEPVIARDLDYIEVSKYTDDDGIRLFLQHAYFKDYLNKWVSDDNAPVNQFVESLVFTGINLKVDDHYLSFKGYSTLVDSLESFAQIVHSSGTGKLNMHKIVPNNSLFFLSIGFEDFSQFYHRLEENIEKSNEGDDYFERKRKLEKYLNINIEDDFLSWMDDEIGIIQTSDPNKLNGYAVVLKVLDVDKAKESLNFVKDQIKKKTPVKFKGVKYKGYNINYLSVKGLFKIVLGKMFSKLEKPYYTFIDNYVVFSNHPGTLAKIITYYEDEKTLIENDQFINYLDQFDSNSSLFFYINSKQLVPDSKEFLSPEYWQLMNENKAYIESFPIFGLQIKPENELIATQILLNYMPKHEIMDWNTLFLPLPLEPADSVITYELKEEEPISTEDIFPDDLSDNRMAEKYSNGQVRFEVALKDGLKNGTYRAYDSLGNVIVKGKYKKDKKTGTWKHYNSEGELIKREKY